MSLDGPSIDPSLIVTSVYSLANSSFLFGCRPNIDTRDYRHSRPKPACVLFVINDDLNRYPLDNLGEVSRCVVRWKQRELKPAPWRHTIDMALNARIREGIDLDQDPLARHDMCQLGFLEVSDHINSVQRNHSHQLRARID